MKVALELKNLRKPNYNYKEKVEDKISSHVRILGVPVAIFLHTTLKTHMIIWSCVCEVAKELSWILYLGLLK
jgi:hypothetical protein